MEAVINHENCDESVLQKIVEILGKNKLLESIDGIKYNDCDTILEAIINHEKCNFIVLSEIVETFGERGLINGTTIRCSNKHYKHYNPLLATNPNKIGDVMECDDKCCDTLLEAIINHEDCNNLVLCDIVRTFGKKGLLNKTTIKYGSGCCNTLLEAIINHENCDEST